MANEVRFIKFDELHLLLELYKHLNPEDKYNLEDINKVWQKIFEDPNLYYFVVEKDNLLVSSCTMAIIKNLTHEGRPYALIENVVTHKDYRKRGYAGVVLKRAIKLAKEKGCYKVMLMTGRKEKSTLDFYERVGFKKDIKIGFIVLL